MVREFEALAAALCRHLLLRKDYLQQSLEKVFKEGNLQFSKLIVTQFLTFCKYSRHLLTYLYLLY